MKSMETKRILLIGNSYTYYNDLYLMYENILKEKNIKAKVETFTYGGAFLTDFISGGKYNNEFISFLKTRHFDYVIIQEQSLRPLTDYDNFLLGAREIKELLKTYNPNIKLFLYETWARHINSDFYKDNKIDYHTATYTLADNYKNVGNTVGAIVIFVGLGFYKMCNEYKEIKLYQDDYSHPTPRGSYLASLLLARATFNINPLEVNYLPSFKIDIDEYDKRQPNKKEANIIKKIASEIDY